VVDLQWFAFGTAVAPGMPMDLRFALRSLWKNPGFAVLAVLVMALGIGANTAVFSVVNSVLLKPLDFHEPDRIVRLSSLWKKSGSLGTVSAPDYHDWHDQSAAFSAMAYYMNGETVVTAGSAAEYAQVAEVGPEFAEVFDEYPTVGRFFTQAEEKYGSGGAAVIGYTFWQSHFGGNPGILGQKLRVEDRSLTIVGVMPPRFSFPEKTQVWLPMTALEQDTPSRSAHNYRVVGRLKPGVTLEQAQGQMTGIAARLEQQYPPSNSGKSAAVMPLGEDEVGSVRPTLFLMLGAVALVLLIACANVSNLLLAKATARTREIAIRSAVGASRGRIVRQLTTESLVLALAAGSLGLLLALWGSGALVALAPRDLPRIDEVRIDGWVLAFTFFVSVAASLLFGLAPALHASRVDLNESLKLGGSRTTAGGAAGRLRGTLVVAEIALSVVLLAGAGLLIKSFVALHNVALGFRPENVLVMETSVPSSSVESERRAVRFYKDLLAQTATAPGVIAAGATAAPPGQIASWGAYFIDRLPSREERLVSAPQAVFSVVTPGAFQALGIPLRRGRDFSERDSEDAPGTAVINDALARAAFGGTDPIGRSIVCGLDMRSIKPMRIVGVVGDVRQGGPAAPAKPEIYMPFEQHSGRSTALSLVVRTTSAPLATSDTLRRKAQAISSDVPVKFTTMEAELGQNVAAPRFRTLLLGIFAGLAVLLAMAGVYGVMAYTVGQRTGEIGLRIALGADPKHVMTLVLGQGLKLAGMGLAIGLLAAVAASKLLTKLLFDVKPTDPATYAAVAVLLGVVALAACYAPARRAMRVDPLVALRQE
jgi:putative ABC transport system permease protein